MKKFLAMLLAACIAFGGTLTLTGCPGKEKEKEKAKKEKVEEKKDKVEEKKEKKEKDA